MGIYVLGNISSASATIPDESSARSIERNNLVAMDLPLYASDHTRELRSGLGCVRGIAFALAIQAAIALFAFILWQIF